MKYDVFISYSSHDQKVVEALCAYLEQYKIRCFVAYRDIPHGTPWANAIVEALDKSRMMLVVFSGNYNRSVQVDREIEIASDEKKPILTIRITDDKYQGAKKYYLKNINWIDIFPKPEEMFGYVARDVAKLLGLPQIDVEPTTQEPVYRHSDDVSQRKSPNRKRMWLWIAAVALLFALGAIFLFSNGGTKERGVATYVESAMNVGLKMVYVEGGTFQMGATEEQQRFSNIDEYPCHSVTLDSYYISATEITQGQWEAVMGEEFWDFVERKGVSWGGVSEYAPTYPAYYISWDDAMAFCRELSRLSGKTYTLPTEAQWEYAARGGAESKNYVYSGSDKIDVVAWYDGEIAPVGLKEPNELGLYDMSGNVQEWCADWYSPTYYSTKVANNPMGPQVEGEGRVVRGGCWYRKCNTDCRVTFRNYGDPSYGGQGHGFRVVCVNTESNDYGAQEGAQVTREEQLRKPGVLAEPIGKISADANKDGVLNLIVDEGRLQTGAEFVLYGEKSVRLNDLSEGVVSSEDILMMAPFGNCLVVTTMSLEEMRQLILSAYNDTGEVLSPSGFAYTIHTDEEGNAVDVEFEIRDEKSEYVVAVTDFIYDNTQYVYTRRLELKRSVSVADYMTEFFKYNLFVVPENTSRVTIL